MFLDASVLIAASRSPLRGSALAMEVCSGREFRAALTTSRLLKNSWARSRLHLVNDKAPLRSEAERISMCYLLISVDIVGCFTTVPFLSA